MLNLAKLQNFYKDLPNKKQYIEFVTALLTVPVLLTVIISNYNNLSSKNKPAEKQDIKGERIIYISPQNSNPKTNSGASNSAKTPVEESPSPKISSPECKKEVGPIEILYPDEGRTVDKNPLCLDISYKVGEYCSVVWSYRLNDEDWSDYTDKSICLYNLTPGDKTLNLKVKSIASDDETVIKRSFTYKNNVTITPSVTIKNSTSSAN